MSVLELTNILLQQTKDLKTLEGFVEDKRLYFNVPISFNLKKSANPFLAAMLIPAMQRGLDIVIPEKYPVSAKLLKNIEELQKIYTFWFPELTSVRIIAKAKVEHPSNDEKAHHTACFFSGGIDACHTLVRMAPKLTHLIYVFGIDLQLNNHKIFEMCINNNRQIANHVGKKLLPIETNIRFFMRDLQDVPLSWYINQASGMASIALALSFPLIYLSSSNPYDAMHPFGSHPLTDPLWATEVSQTIHTGCDKRRHEKIEELAEHDYILQRIRICWHDKSFNCGVCDKCLHFRVALAILGLNIQSFQPLTSFANLSGAHVKTRGEFLEWQDNLFLAKKMGNKEAEKAVLKLLNKYKLKKALRLLDESLIGGRLMSLKNSLMSMK